MSNHCTCTVDGEVTCIVHPTQRSMKKLIAELTAEVERLRRFVESITQNPIVDSEITVKMAHHLLEDSNDENKN